jgi:beta-ribofuranosylaminobenzene 5'-phosphate synthase
MTTAVQVRAPCRLHFGMFGFGYACRAQFGGVGVMVEPPSVNVRISPASCFTARGSVMQRQRTQHVVARLATQWELRSLPACEVVVSSPRDHTGLGVGTQLSLAITAGLRRFLKLGELSTEDLAVAAGRGARSAVGTHGFLHGGLIVDAGKKSIDELGKLAARATLPEEWRFVLICPVGEQGLAGEGELLAFERLPPVSDEITRELWAITTGHMLPALANRDCGAFGQAVFQFGRRAGDCFSAVQEGPFASDAIARLVASIRAFGVTGIGQSSWGPTVYAITSSDEEAKRLIDWMRDRSGSSEYEITVARPNNCGATVEG